MRENTSVEAPFALIVQPREDGRYALAIAQHFAGRENGRDREPRQLVRIWGSPLLVTMDQILEALRKTGYRATQLGPHRKKPFIVDEETGVRLGLLMMAVKPLRRLDRIETIADAIRHMGSEEAYYWFSKCVPDGTHRRARKALRILLS